MSDYPERKKVSSDGIEISEPFCKECGKKTKLEAVYSIGNYDMKSGKWVEIRREIHFKCSYSWNVMGSHARIVWDSSKKNYEFHDLGSRCAI